MNAPSPSELAEVTALLTWPVYGTWLGGEGRGGRIGSCDDASFELPEPDEELSRQQRPALKWPVVQLDRSQRELIERDLARIARERGFRISALIVGADHLHLVLARPRIDDVPRLVQIIKGSLARTLTVAAGDEPARSRSGAALPRHKWWMRQYVFQRLPSESAIRRALALLASHPQAS